MGGTYTSSIGDTLCKRFVMKFISSKRDRGRERDSEKNSHIQLHNSTKKSNNNKLKRFHRFYMAGDFVWLAVFIKLRRLIGIEVTAHFTSTSNHIIFPFDAFISAKLTSIHTKWSWCARFLFPFLISACCPSFTFNFHLNRSNAKCNGIRALLKRVNRKQIHS